MPPFVTPIPRRRLFAVLALGSPLLVAQRRRARGAVERLDPATLRAVAEVVLPSSLSLASREAAVGGFERWLAGYRAGAELLHGYGAAETKATPPSPAPRFEADLNRLDQAARAQRGAAFAVVARPARMALVEAALQKAAGPWPSIAEAGHVAIGLLAHWAESTAGYDMAYQVQINRFGCRPLASTTERPKPLGGSG